MYVIIRLLMILSLYLCMDVSNSVDKGSGGARKKFVEGRNKFFSENTLDWRAEVKQKKF